MWVAHIALASLKTIFQEANTGITRSVAQELEGNGSNVEIFGPLVDYVALRLLP